MTTLSRFNNNNNSRLGEFEVRRRDSDSLFFIHCLLYFVAHKSKEKEKYGVFVPVLHFLLSGYSRNE